MERKLGIEPQNIDRQAGIAVLVNLN